MATRSLSVAAAFLFCMAVLAAAAMAADQHEDHTAASVGAVLQAGVHQRRLLTMDCPRACDGRCSAAGSHKRCEQLCLICCKECQCVPPGTYGNKEVCPCYAKLKNDRGTDKCP